MRYIKLTLKLAWASAGNAWNGFLAFTVLLVLLALLLHLRGLYVFFDTSQNGFVPQVVLRFPQSIRQDQIQQLQTGVRETSHEADIIFGASQVVKQAGFEVKGIQTLPEGIQTLPHPLTILGLFYGEEATLEITRGSESLQAELLSFTGGAFLDVASNPALRDGPCSLSTPSGALDMIAICQGDQTRLYIDDEKSGNEQAFQDFILELVSKSVDPTRSGIGWDRFASGESEATAAFDVFRWRFCQAYGPLLFGGADPIKVLSTQTLHRQLTPYRSIENTRLSIRTKTVPLRILDVFHFPVDGILSTHTILLNYKHMGQLSGQDVPFNIAFIYGRSPTVADLSSICHKLELPVEIHTRSQFFAGDQTAMIYWGVGGMSALFCLIVILNLGMRLMFYYKRNKKEIALLRTYGFRGFPFVATMFIALLAAIPIALFILQGLRISADQIFKRYLFPPLFPSNEVYWGPPLIALCMCLMIWGLEILLVKQGRQQQENKTCP